MTWRNINTAPKNGKFLWLLVDYSKGGGPLEDATIATTLGFNSLDDTGEDEWQFVGWDWEQDCFQDGHGEVVGWMPCYVPPTPTKSRSDEEGPIWHERLGWDMKGYK